MQYSLTDNLHSGSLQITLKTPSFCLLISALFGILCLSIWTFPINQRSSAAAGIPENTGIKKLVILNFDDGRKTQFTQAKPILDKYGYKATFYVVCQYSDSKKGYMNWTELETLHREGHDIESHTNNHADL